MRPTALLYIAAVAGAAMTSTAEVMMATPEAAQRDLFGLHLFPKRVKAEPHVPTDGAANAAGDIAGTLGVAGGGIGVLASAFGLTNTAINTKNMKAASKTTAPAASAKPHGRKPPSSAKPATKARELEAEPVADVLPPPTPAERELFSLHLMPKRLKEGPTAEIAKDSGVMAGVLGLGGGGVGLFSSGLGLRNTITNTKNMHKTAAPSAAPKPHGPKPASSAKPTSKSPAPARQHLRG